ncbi:hypothetical protein [Paenibacillus mesotrionivorans]|uniref:Uncharacterized protein n=1 Tax=Paenibacillus mesotrionivorans TaxID=3160968 RepID=A0ACC7NUC1_9BACL
MRQKRARRHSSLRRMAPRSLVLSSLCMTFTVLALDAVVHPTYSQYSSVHSISGTLSAGAVFPAVYGMASKAGPGCTFIPANLGEPEAVSVSVYEPGLLDGYPSLPVYCSDTPILPPASVTESVYTNDLPVSEFPSPSQIPEGA